MSFVVYSSDNEVIVTDTKHEPTVIKDYFTCVEIEAKNRVTFGENFGV